MLAVEAGITMKLTAQKGHALAFVSCVAVAACMQQPPSSSTTTTTGATITAHPRAAHALLVETASCWMGGVWGDSEARCEEVVRDVWGRSNRERWIQLRAFDPKALDVVKLAMDRRALRDPAESRNVDGLDRIFTRLAFAEQEATVARRASHRIARDWDHERDRLNDEESRALPELEHTIAFEELWKTDAGELTAEAKVLALLVLLDRIRVAEMLPLHLKPYVVAEPFHVVFGATPPNLPHDASKSLERGAWLAFLVDAARQARHPVNDETTDPRAKHQEAMAGILAGIADQVEQNTSAIGDGTPLADVSRRTIRALRPTP